MSNGAVMASIYLLRPVSKKCRDWLDENVTGETTWWGTGSNRSLAVEHGYVEALVDGMIESGLRHGHDFDVKPAR